LSTIALLLGDPAGVGPEVAAKLLADAGAMRLAEVLVIGDPAVLEAGERAAGIGLSPRPALRKIEVNGKVELGRASAAGGRAALAALDAAVDAAKRGEVQGIVFAPLNKQAMKLAGLKHEDELRYMQERFDARGFVSEFNITAKLWTSRVTSHIPLHDVGNALTVQGVCDAIEILDRSLRAAGTERPRIGVAGLNPHAGDGGKCGREEIDIIAPAIERMRAQGVEATGPHSADTVFIAARDGRYDAVVTMYHDQGQIAMKLLGFEHGVTLHGGLPVPVATCASGTAYDIAGRGIARYEGLKRAFELTAAMACRQRSP